MYNTDFPTRAELPGSAQLLRSTLIAFIVAAVLLVTTVLPSEFGIDPTGIGRVLGLTQMGEIKRGLSAEAVAEAAPAVEADEEAVPAPEVAAQQSSAPPPLEMEHTMSITLKPGQGAEIKLTMNKDSIVQFEWTTEGGPLNYDTHGDPFGAPRSFYHGYGKGRNKPGHSGTLKAAFDGTHGWFWRNRTNNDVTVTLKTRGEYQEIKRVI